MSVRSKGTVKVDLKGPSSCPFRMGDGRCRIALFVDAADGRDWPDLSTEYGIECLETGAPPECPIREFGRIVVEEEKCGSST